MMYAKTGNWYADNPWFANANNSVVLKRDEVKKKQFKRIFQMTRQWGEPGFYFTNNYDYGTNPCGEVALFSILTVDASLKEELEKQKIKVEVGETYSGWGFCNLCEINAAKFTCHEDFEAAAKAATLIGTLQATYTKMPYLGWVSEQLAKRDALLGISMTGMLDAPDISCNPEYQKKIAKKIKECNIKYATRLGIRPAARTTCIKPSGTASLLLNCVASGHHAHHARRYIRRVIADESESVFQAFKLVNPHMCLRKPSDGKFVIEFPVEVSSKAIIKEDLSALKFLEMIKSTQQNWVLTGTSDKSLTVGLNHNVSNTVTVKPDEWDSVLDYLWINREFFTGVTLLSNTGDKDYAFSPNEAITTAADEQRWNDILLNYQPLDYTALVENEDGTHVSMEPACTGGVCSLV
jgi:ribonucleoside-diphosphate reductase alpha chain